MFKKIILSTAILMATANAQAEIVITDCKTIGDEFAFIDTDTGVEWMRYQGYRSVRELSGKSGSDALSIIETHLPGWKFPTLDEVMTLAGNTIEEDIARKLVVNNMSLISNVTNRRQNLGSSRVYTGEQHSFRPFADAFGTVSSPTQGQYARPYFYDGRDATGTNNLIRKFQHHHLHALKH
jgi:hypothetical protein